MRRELPLRFVIARVGETSLSEYGFSASPVDSAQVVRDFWLHVIAARPEHEPDKEHLIVLVVNTKLRPKGYHVASIGSLNEAIAHPREIFRPVLALAGYGFLLAHNHPSGDPTPSQADRRLTKQIGEGADILQLKFLDHVIVGDEKDQTSFFSFRESGLL